MTSARQFYEQQPSLSVVPPQKDWPTMYDLPSEDPQEPGLPDEFHDLQPQLLSATLRLSDFAKGEIFTAKDMNLYYDLEHLGWYKRPDWFAVLGIPRLYEGRDLRLSYLVWDEPAVPTIIVELISKGTAKSDLGEVRRDENGTPTKWEVYEQILKVPYYLVYDRNQDTLWVFLWQDGVYQQQEILDGRFWFKDLGIGIGLWDGEYEGITRSWLRWYDAGGHWHLTQAEAESRRADQERSRADQERSQREAAERENQRLRDRLKSLGIGPNDL
ncbi:MAG: Uma2 family endonuclease [Acaryochloridaceae cyanobacterium RL_2_7]|nr:Uma2 family endonuclease [Acaryochloridaceae cyanobacterium RL_2_7]